MNYYSSCVAWPTNDVHSEGGLSDMVDQARDVTRRAFLKHVNRECLAEIEQQLAYARHPRRGLTMAGDYCVAYSRSRHHGKRVYFFTHSAIEFVFR